MSRAILWMFLLFLPFGVKGDPRFSHESQVLQDPKTKIIYYVESDRRHVAAISPDGKLLWCTLVIPKLKKVDEGFQETFHIDGIGFKDDDNLSVGLAMGSGGIGTLNKTTGVLTFPHVML